MTHHALHVQTAIASPPPSMTEPLGISDSLHCDNCAFYFPLQYQWLLLKLVATGISFTWAKTDFCWQWDS